MSILEAIIQGIVQGLTEFLPVSSSGHLSLTQHFLGISGDTAFIMDLALHLGTLIAVFVAFKEKIWVLIKEAISLLKDIFTGKFKWSTMNGDRRMIIMIIISILPLFLFYIWNDAFESVASDTDIIIEGVCFLYTSAILFIGDRFSKKNTCGKNAGETTVKDALVIGFMQGVALLPGVSRSGSTISAGQICGIKREDAVEYSFILGIPVILAGALSELLDISSDAVADVNMLPIIVGVIVAAISGYLAIKLVKWLMVSNKFSVFAIYTLCLGAIVLCIGIYEHMAGVTISL